MVVYLQGLLNDGSNPNPASPVDPNTRQMLTLPQGGSVTVRLKVVTPADFPAPQTGTLVLTAKKQPQQIPAIFTVTGTWVTSAPGEAVFEIPGTATRLMEFGWYCYDIWLVNGASRNQIVAVSPLIIQPTALPPP